MQTPPEIAPTPEPPASAAQPASELHIWQTWPLRPSAHVAEPPQSAGQTGHDDVDGGSARRKGGGGGGFGGEGGCDGGPTSQMTRFFAPPGLFLPHTPATPLIHASEAQLSLLSPTWYTEPSGQEHVPPHSPTPGMPSSRMLTRWYPATEPPAVGGGEGDAGGDGGEGGGFGDAGGGGGEGEIHGIVGSVTRAEASPTQSANWGLHWEVAQAEQAAVRPPMHCRKQLFRVQPDRLPKHSAHRVE